ncbi:MAG: response regulator transcription factor [Lachnospiraceae bacterium]|jgi:two-component system response regulator ResD|nr:response regulator transcription factor [Lachnospiraceae bacterium]
MPNLLIIDDDAHLRKLVRTYGELEGFACDEAEDGESALEIFQKKDFDLIVLDVMMPGMDGFQVLEAIRQDSRVPVIMLTARDEEYDKLTGFDLGADDYVPKPFSPKELMARIRAVLRRTGKIQTDSITFGDLSILPSSRTVTIQNQKLNLPPKEFDLLLKLSQNENIVLSREKLLQTVWGYNYYGDVRTVDTHIKSLREHLGEYRKLIQTVWGVGYKLEYTEEI